MEMQVVMGLTLKRSYVKPENLFAQVVKKNHCIRVVTKMSSCWVNTTSRRGIKWLGISFGSIFVLFCNKSSRGPLS